MAPTASPCRCRLLCPSDSQGALWHVALAPLQGRGGSRAGAPLGAMQHLQGFHSRRSAQLEMMSKLYLEQALFDGNCNGCCADVCRRQQKGCRMPWAIPQHWCSSGVQSQARWPSWSRSVMALSKRWGMSQAARPPIPLVQLLMDVCRSGCQLGLLKPYINGQTARVKDSGWRAEMHESRLVAFSQQR